MKRHAGSAGHAMASDAAPPMLRVTADRERFGALLYAERWRRRLASRAASILVDAPTRVQGRARLQAWESGEQLPTATELSRYLERLRVPLDTQRLLATWLRLASGAEGGLPESAAPVLVELVRPVPAQRQAPAAVAAPPSQAEEPGS